MIALRLVSDSVCFFFSKGKGYHRGLVTSLCSGDSTATVESHRHITEIMDIMAIFAHLLLFTRLCIWILYNHHSAF